MTMLGQLLDIRSLDPEDQRRRKLLTILLIGMAALSLISLLVLVIFTVTGMLKTSEEIILFYGGTISVLLGVAIFYAINRFWSGSVAASGFLLLLIAVLAFSDSPHEVAVGRTLFLFTLPVIMASVVLRPYFSFIAAAIVSAVVTAAALSIGLEVQVAVIAGFFAIALVSWLAARSLEAALIDLHKINRNLDNLVNERTRELYDALRQVSAESSKNQAILESIADGVIVFDEQGKAFSANPSIAQLIDRPTDQITGRTIEGLMETEVKPQDKERVLERLRSEEQSAGSIRADWGKKVLSVTSAAVRDPNKQNIGTVMVFRDVTVEAELEKMKSAFLSMASHELRTPLNAILGYSDMMRQGALGPVSGEQEKGLERVMSNGERMLNLVNNLLDQAQIEAGQIMINKHPFPVKNLIEDVVSTMRVLAEQKEIELKYSIADGVPAEINSDQQRLHQIVMNLVGNAIKFTDNGHVSINLTRPDKDHWALEVEDTGMGMPEDAKAYIFETFRQVNDPTTRKHQGSGLGLSIVKQLVELLGGEITVETTLGKGSTFKAVLPVETLVMEKA